MRGRLTIALGVLLCAGTAQAQMSDYLVSVSFFKAKPGQNAALTTALKESVQPTLEQLRGQGAVMAFGLDEADVHHAGEFTHSIWMAHPGLQTIDLLAAAIEKNPKPLRVADLTEPDSHQDLVLRSVYTKTSPAPAAGKRILVIKRFRVERDKEAAFKAFFDKYYKPILDPLVDDGTLEAHGLMTEEFVSQEPGTQWHWMRARNREAIGKAIAAIGAAIGKMPPAELSQMLGERRSLIVAGSAHDDVWQGDFYPGAMPGAK